MTFWRKNAAVVKLLAFVVVTLTTTFLVAITIANQDGLATRNYKAIFSDVTGLQAGDDVRIAGVKVGRVNYLRVHGTDAEVGLAIRSDVSMRTSSTARVRYRDLLGRRYVAIADPGGEGSPVPGGATIPLDHTQPALDLTVLFNGFRPIFHTLQPKDVNRLSAEIIATLQGEGGTVDALLSHTASITNTLADRDATIGRVVTNLSSILGTVAVRDQALGQLIVNLRNLAGGLSGDRDAIASSLTNIDSLAAAAAGLLSDARPSLDPSIRDLNTVVQVAAENKGVIGDALQRLPSTLDALVRATSYGSWINLYLCDFRVTLSSGQTVDANNGAQNSPRCKT